jgi:hypothetical protein
VAPVSEHARLRGLNLKFRGEQGGGDLYKILSSTMVSLNPVSGRFSRQRVGTGGTSSDFLA